MKFWLLLALLGCWTMSLAACASPTVVAPPAPTEVPLIADTVSVPMSFAREPTLISLASLGGEIQIRGQGEQLIQGSITRSAAIHQPSLSTAPGSINLSQAVTNTSGDRFTAVNRWDLQMNGAAPLQINIVAGPQQGTYDLGNMRLRSFNMTEGNSTTKINFSTPNMEDMRRMTIKTGVSKYEMLNLLNGRFASMVLDGDGGEYSLDFSGKPQRPAQALIRVPNGVVTIRVPAETGAKLTVSDGPAPTVIGNLLPDVGSYITANWRKAQNIEVVVSTGKGAITFEAR